MADRITDERLREIVEGTYCGFDEGSAIAAELLAARADLREAVSLLRNTDWEKDNWDERYEALLAKHKETP